MSAAPNSELARVEALAATTSARKRHVRSVPNRGRDMAPFLLLLAQIRDDDHQILLKLHTKKSTHRIDGAVWRSELLSNLLDPELVSVTLNALRRPGPFGIVGPKGHIVSMRTYRGANIDRVRQYSHALGVASLNEDKDPFVAGSMFFARVDCLDTAPRPGPFH